MRIVDKEMYDMYIDVITSVVIHLRKPKLSAAKGIQAVHVSLDRRTFNGKTSRRQRFVSECFFQMF